jgi:alanine-alpha-ketoisovalerate/valine-pyruvate aminotransferase
MMPQRKQNFLLTAGDLINFIYSSETFSTKFNDGNMLRMNLPINKNILNGETYEYSVDNKFKVPALIQREIYNTAVLLFDPRIQDLSISNRINAEKILFSIRNIK